MATEYRFNGLNPRTRSLGISVGVGRKIAEIELSERELINLIVSSAVALDSIRKAREAETQP